MGWTYQHATYYKNGKIDRKAECDAYFTESNAGWYKVEKSALVGKVYYAAIRQLRGFKDGKTFDIPESEQKVSAVVFLTDTNTKDYYNFGYKEMDESMIPCYYDCPAGILKLLSPTDNDWSNEWRERCREYAAEKRAAKKNPNSLENLPIGTVIKCCETELVKSNPAGQFKKPFWRVKGKWAYYQKKFIQARGFEIISKPATV